MSVAELPAGFHDPSIAVVRPSARSRANGALGEVDIALNGGGAVIVYVVFRTRSGALRDFASASGGGFASRPLASPITLPRPRSAGVRVIRSKSKAGTPVATHVAEVRFVDGSTAIATLSTGASDRLALPAATRLADFARSHLDKFTH
jgi:hypothetical protein